MREELSLGPADLIKSMHNWLHYPGKGIEAIHVGKATTWESSRERISNHRKQVIPCELQNSETIEKRI